MKTEIEQAVGKILEQAFDRVDFGEIEHSIDWERLWSAVLSHVRNASKDGEEHELIGVSLPTDEAWDAFEKVLRKRLVK